MVKVSYKDVIILLLVVSQILLIFHIIMSKGDNDSQDSYFLSRDNLSGYMEDDVKGDRWVRDINVNNSNNSSEAYNNITDNRSGYSGVNNYNVSEMYNNSILHPRKNTYTVKNVSLNELFLDLHYSNVIKISENGKKGIVKTYEKDGRVINFDVRNYKPDLDNPRYVKVSKERKPFKYGVYYRYKYILQYENNTSVNYCYYREVGNYHIIMGFDKEDEFVRDMWLRWNEYIESTLYQ